MTKSGRACLQSLVASVAPEDQIADLVSVLEVLNQLLVVAVSLDLLEALPGGIASCTSLAQSCRQQNLTKYSLVMDKTLQMLRGASSTGTWEELESVFKEADRRAESGMWGALERTLVDVSSMPQEVTGLGGFLRVAGEIIDHERLCEVRQLQLCLALVTAAFCIISDIHNVNHHHQFCPPQP